VLPSWLSAVGLAGAMFAAFALGRGLGRRWPALGRTPVASRIDRAVVGTLGLLLAFTFSLALSEFQQRRTQAVEDANAIGRFYACASFLDEPTRGNLQRVIRRYLERRVTVAHAPNKMAALARELPDINRMQSEMHDLVGEAVAKRSPIAIRLIDTLNELVSHHVSRLAAIRYRLPWPILILLGMAAIGSTLIVGTQQGAAGDDNPVPITVFVLLVSLVVWVTLELNHPGTGVVTVSQEPLERLLASMPR
jgi:hypothetical protein